MLATIERVQILALADELSRMVLQSEAADEYRKYYFKINNDKRTQEKIREFVKMKELYEEVQRFGRYHPDYKTINVRTREVKREMDMDENIANFRRAENDLQDILDHISVIVGKSVSQHIKVPTGNPFFDANSSCSGGCGSGGGCSCSA